MVTGENSNWLLSCIGPIISAIVAFIILNRQIVQNRSIIRKQLEHQKVADYKRAFVDYMAATNCNKFVNPLNYLFTDTEAVFELTKNIIDEEYHPFMTLKLLQEDTHNCERLFEEIILWRNLFIFTIKNIHTTASKIIDSRRNNTDLRSDIESEERYVGDYFHEFIKDAPEDDGTRDAYEKRVQEAHTNEYNAIKPLQAKMFDIMHSYILYKESEINNL